MSDHDKFDPERYPDIHFTSPDFTVIQNGSEDVLQYGEQTIYIPPVNNILNELITEIGN